ncbi:MAG: mannanase [Paenibacillaceae bacterium]|jgi:mannan endo-1,4-beta-mannosidase|nr:mannanase [Paenibacillaceae bacterium]
MKKKNLACRLLSVVLAAGLLFPASLGVAAGKPQQAEAPKSIAVAATEATAKGLAGHWARESMEAWAARGILEGYEDGGLHPDEALTRAEFAAVMNRVFGFYAESEQSFADVHAGDWYAKPLRIARQAGYLQGVPGNKALPSEPVSRQEAVTLLARLFSLEGEGGITGYADDSLIADYARSGLKALSEFVAGYEDGTFRPSEPLTRAEAVTLLDRLVQGYYSAEGVFGEETVTGHAIVSHSGVVLRNTVVEGNLYLAAGIGDGDVELEGVQVKGTVFVNGGGGHTVSVRDSTLQEVQVDRKEGAVRLVVAGNTQIGSITVQSPSGLELEAGTRAEGITAAAPLTLNVAKDAHVGTFTVAPAGGGTTVTLAGEIAAAVIRADGVQVNGVPVAKGGELPGTGSPAVAAGNTGGDIGGSSGGDTGGSSGGDTGGSSGGDSGGSSGSDSGGSSGGDTGGSSGGDTGGSSGGDTGGSSGGSNGGHTGGSSGGSSGGDTGGSSGGSSGGDTGGSSGGDTGGSSGGDTGGDTGGSSGGDSGGSSGGDTGGSSGGSSGGDTGEPEPEVVTVDLADADATPETRSLFAYLRGVMGNEIIFGQQAAMSEGVTITVKDGTQSDTLNSVGDLPGVFGFDVQNLEGTSYQANRDRMVMLMKAAYREGGILTASGHIPNMVTGGNYNDTTGNAATRILPGGDKNAVYNHFMDRVAELAELLKDENGTPIPVIFRPFHEQNGSWFWWGAAYRSNEQYMELYRYTVEYLRDIKGVHNFLYAYSPNSPFGGSEARYLESYPGDEYVDVLGFDSYYNGTAATWYENAVQDAKLVASIANQRNKIPAFTEFGYKYIDSEGKDPEFYTKLLAALQADPDARQTAYMMTWVNWSAASSYVPYKNAPNGLGDHPLLPDFTAFYADDYTAFRNEVRNAEPYHKETAAASEQPFLHVVHPTNNLDVALTEPTILRVRILNENVQSAVYSIEGDDQEYPLTLDEAGFYYTAEWTPQAAMAETDVTLTVKAYGASGNVLTESVHVYVSEGAVSNPLIVDTFEGYRGKDELLKGAYGSSGDTNTISLDPVHKNSGNYGIKYEYSVGTGYTGRTKAMNLADWSEANKLRFWMEPDGSDQKLVIQINAGSIAFEAYPSLAGTAAGLVEIPFSEFKPAAWNTVNAGKVITKKALKGVKAFSIYINRNPDAAGTRGTLYFDDIEAYHDPSIPEVPFDQDKIFGFEDGTLQGFQINVKDSTMTAEGLSVTTAVYASGTQSLTTSFNLSHATNPAKGGELQIRRQSTASTSTVDLTGYKQVTAKIKIVPEEGAHLPGNLAALIYMQSGASWSTYTFKRVDNLTQTDAAGFVTLTLPIEAVPDLNLCQVIGLKIFAPAGSTGTAAVYIDDVVIS